MENKQRLRDLMAWHGVKCADVALLIHRSKNTVSQYACGVRPISDELLKTLEQKLLIIEGSREKELEVTEQ